MKDRLLTFVLAAAAFAVFYALLAPKPTPPQERVTRPVTTEQGPNGYHAMYEWLRRSGVEVESVRDRYNRLEPLKDTSEGNLLITTAPHLYPLRNSELQPLRAWVARGNTLVVLAGLSDTPEWSMGEGADTQLMERLEQLTGLKFTADGAAAAGEASRETPGSAADASETPPESEETSSQSPFEAVKKYPEPRRFELEPNGAHPLLSGVERVTALSEYPTLKWRAVASPERVLLELAHERETGVPVLWLMRYGEGQMLVSAYGSLFTNKLLGVTDNARLLSNVVARSVQPGGRVLIDDAHQGLVAFYDPDAFFGDRRLHVTLWWLIGLWLVFVLGPRPFLVNPAHWKPLEVLTFVRSTGGFLARVLNPSQAALRLFENFFDELRRRRGLPANGAPLWEAIEAQSSVPVADIQQLRRLYDRAVRGARIDLPRVQTLLSRTRSNLR